MKSKPDSKTNVAKQVILIVAVLLIGAVLGWLILATEKSESGEAQAEESHAEASGHTDDEHHGKQSGRGGKEHDHAEEHADSEHHERAADGRKAEGSGEHDETIKLTDAQIKDAGIAIATAEPARIKTSITLPGEIRFNEDRTAHVLPRLGGQVESVSASLGDQVKKGQTLAVIASTELAELRSDLLAANQRRALAKVTYQREKQLWEEKISAQQDYLQAEQAMREAEIAVQRARQKLTAFGVSASGKQLNRYELKAPFDGTLTEKHISLGESVKEDTRVFTISDLSSVWAEIVVPARDLDTIRVGQNVTVNATAFESKASGEISYVGPLVGEQTRTARARAVIANPDLSWRPGLFVNVQIVANETGAPVAIVADAVQSVEDKPTVFIKIAGGFKAQPVTLGKSDGEMVEVVKGIDAGTRYAAAGSFVIKSELGKASAEHAH